MAVPDIPRTPAPITQRVVNWFVDRQLAFEQFCRMARGDALERVMVVCGPEGIGKTWLLLNLADHLGAAPDGPHIPVTYLDFAWNVPFDELLLVQWVAQDMGREHFPRLDAALKAAMSVNVIVQRPGDAGQPTTVFQREVHIYGDYAGRDIIKNNTFNTQVGRDLIQVWMPQIVEAFLADLAALGPAVMLVDSFERMGDQAQAWLLNTLLPRIGSAALAHTRLAIAGRDAPAFPGTWQGLVYSLTLDDLPADEVRRYLAQKRGLVLSDEVVRQIVDLTRGRPSQVAIFADRPALLPGIPDPARLTEILVQGILADAPPSTRDTLQAVAIPEWFDVDLLAALLPQGDRDARLQVLKPFSFVEPHGNRRWAVSASARKALLASLDGSPARTLALHAAAARHFAHAADNAADAASADELYRQAMGHWLVADERLGRSQLRALFEQNAAHYRLAVCENLLKRARAVAGVTPLTMAWIDFLELRLALAQARCKDPAAQLEAIAARPDADAELAAHISWALGDVNATAGAWSASIKCYEAALAYFRREGSADRSADVMVCLGDVYLAQARSLGDPIEPNLIKDANLRGVLRALPALVVAFPFVLYARFVCRWTLPPLQQGMNYRNWALMRCLLTAVQWYQQARGATPGGAPAGAQRGEALAYHWLGWHARAERMFDLLLPPDTARRPAHDRCWILMDRAETHLAAGRPAEVVTALRPVATALKDYQDCSGVARAELLLGQAALQQGRFGEGLALLSSSLSACRGSGDHPQAGRVLRALREWLDAGRLPPEHARRARELIAETETRVYPAAVTDAAAAWLEAGVVAGLAGIAIASVVLYISRAIGSWATLQAFFAHLFSLQSILIWLGSLILAVWVFLVVVSVVGFGLVLRGARPGHSPKPLGQFIVSTTTFEHQAPGSAAVSIEWAQVAGVAIVERCLWRQPLALLSGLWVFGPNPGAPVWAPATVPQFEWLRNDIIAHATGAARRDLGVRLLASPLGALFLAFPILLVTGAAVVYRWAGWAGSVDLAAGLGPPLLHAGFFALAASLYGWFLLHPLWVRCQLTSIPRAPLFAVAAGLLIVAVAYALSYLLPFFPARNSLNRLVFPAGFALAVLAPVWLLFTRAWSTPLVRRGPPAYAAPIRVASVAALVLALSATAWYARREWYPELAYNFQAITYFYHGAYAESVDRFDHLLALNPDLVNGYAYRGRANIELGNLPAAVRDLDRIIDSGQGIAADYVFRAVARYGTGDPRTACADLHTALTTARWPLGADERARVTSDYWMPWGCE